jgi:hypothetical protein
MLAAPEKKSVSDVDSAVSIVPVSDVRRARLSFVSSSLFRLLKRNSIGGGAPGMGFAECSSFRSV